MASSFRRGTPLAQGASVRGKSLGPTDGYLYVEYVIIALFAGVAVAISMASLGPKLVDAYSTRRAVLYSPTP